MSISWDWEHACMKRGCPSGQTALFISMVMPTLQYSPRSERPPLCGTEGTPSRSEHMSRDYAASACSHERVSDAVPGFLCLRTHLPTAFICRSSICTMRGAFAIS